MVLKQTFSLLGEYRDKEILQIKTQPLLESVGAPHVEWSTAIDIMPIDAVRANDFQILLLELIGFTPVSYTHLRAHETG
jgi:triphosphatase